MAAETKETGMDFEIGTEAEVAQAKSKFITLPPGAKIGVDVYLALELQMPDWDTVNVSIKFPIIVTQEGLDFGKEDKLSTGIGAKGWKLVETLDRLKVEKRKNANGQVVFDRTKVAGRKAVGHWQAVMGKNQSTGNEFLMMKLQEIMPEDFKVPENQKIM